MRAAYVGVREHPSVSTLMDGLDLILRSDSAKTLGHQGCGLQDVRLPGSNIGLKSGPGPPSVRNRDCKPSRVVVRMPALHCGEFQPTRTGRRSVTRLIPAHSSPVTAWNAIKISFPRISGVGEGLFIA